MSKWLIVEGRSLEMLWVLDLIGRGETALEVGRESDVELAILCGRCVDEPAGGGVSYVTGWTSSPVRRVQF